MRIRALVPLISRKIATIVVETPLQDAIVSDFFAIELEVVSSGPVITKTIFVRNAQTAAVAGIARLHAHDVVNPRLISS